MILPTQNPDGREIGQRRNLNGFDMNRDWFARTQPETDGKLDVIRQYPPMLFIDAHEFGLADYFFPPNADPEYHEIPDHAHNWINQLYSPAIIDQFNQAGIKFFHGAPYDFFAIVFGDTVPTAGLPRRGHDVRKGERRPDRGSRARALHLDLGFDRGRRRGSRPGPRRLAPVVGRRPHQEAAGVLEDNNIFEPRHKLLQEVPDQTIRGFYLLDDPDRAYELDLLIRRLQRMGVEVRELSAPLALSDFHPYGDPGGPAVLPAGTYWITTGPGQEALDPLDAERGDVDPIRRHVRRDGLEQPAADEPRGRLEWPVGLAGLHAGTRTSTRRSGRSQPTMSSTFSCSRSTGARGDSSQPATPRTCSATSGACRSTTCS